MTKITLHAVMFTYGSNNSENKSILLETPGTPSKTPGTHFKAPDIAYRHTCSKGPQVGLEPTSLLWI